MEPESWGTFSSQGSFPSVLFYLKIYRLIFFKVSGLATISICSNGFLLLKNIIAKFHFKQIQQSLLKLNLHSLTIYVSPFLDSTFILLIITRLSASNYGPSISTLVKSTDSLTFFTSWWFIAFIWLPEDSTEILLLRVFMGQDWRCECLAAAKSCIRVLNMNFFVSLDIRLLLK